MLINRLLAVTILLCFYIFSELKKINVLAESLVIGYVGEKSKQEKGEHCSRWFYYLFCLMIPKNLRARFAMDDAPLIFPYCTSLVASKNRQLGVLCTLRDKRITFLQIYIMTKHILFKKISTNVFMLIMCESQENACSDKISFFHLIIWKTLIKNEILEAIRKKKMYFV